jgi:hypothetical protein
MKKDLRKLIEDSEESKEKENVPTKKQLINWLKDNPNPEDEDLHKWAEDNGWDIHEVEDMMYKIATKHVEEEREPYLAAGEGDEEQADVAWKKKKGWSKFLKKIKREIKK